ncbi:MAG: efflux RND transporter periplasmic adaptor subunit [Pirellulales bacterium]
MSKSIDSSVREIGDTRLLLRTDLIFTPQTDSGESYYLIEDPLNSRFFRLGLAEYTLVSLMDGQTTMHRALSWLSTVMPRHHLTENDAAGLCQWLVEMDLAATAESVESQRLVSQAERREVQQLAARFNPLAFRWPLWRSSDRLLGWFTAWLGWIFSPPAAIAWLALVGIGAYQVMSQWARFLETSEGIFGPHNWIWLALCWAVLKVVHELAHGIACKRYGGNVREFGILFLMFAPLAYVDVTSSWRFRDKWQRIIVAAAGMYVELAIASAAAWIWSQQTTGWEANLSFNVVVMAGISTLVFNANPLMKFDGYYILSDWLGLPNLYPNGQWHVRSVVRRVFLGVPAATPSWQGLRGWLIRTYGWASLVWRIFMAVSLIVTAITLFHGAGIVLAVLAFAAWFVAPSFKFVRYLVVGVPGERPRSLRFLGLAGGLSVALIGLLGFTPWPGVLSAPGVVEYSPPTVLRARSAGFVRDVLVADGQRVEEGELIAVLESDELMRELADLDLQIRQSELRARRLEQKHDYAGQQAEIEQREALELQRAEKQAQVANLQIHAPRAGQIVRRGFDSLVGTYLEEGDEVATMGDESLKEVRISLSQDDLDEFSRREGRMVRVDFPRQALWHGRLDQVLPRATHEPLHPALAAVNGGPLPVRREQVENDDSQGKSDYVLLAPRFTALVPLDAALATTLRVGQRATVSFRPCDESIGEHLYRGMSSWIRERLARPQAP